MQRRNGVGALVAGGALALLSGCGLNVMVMVDPISPFPGQNVDFTVMVKNETNCTVSEAGVLLATFLPIGDGFPDDFCALLSQIGPGDIGEIERTLGEFLPPAMVGRLMQSAQDRLLGTSPAGTGQGPPACTPADLGTAQGIFDPGFLEFECDIGTIDPLEKVTLNFSVPAPDSGPVRTIALALGRVPSGEQCPPAAPGFDVVLGCFDSAARVQPAPLMSVSTMIVTALALVGVGTYGALRRRRNA